MMEQRKLQVFVSSTYTDMCDERQAAVEAILEAGHIPAGMELFAANNETQWNTIKKWIDDSSVFLLVLGGRYGTIDKKSGQSYIEMEFQYARDSKREVFALVMSNKYLEAKEKKFLNEVARVDQISKLAEVRHPEKLTKFRESVRTGRIAPECKSLDELKHRIVLSLGEISKKKSLAAWIPDTPESMSALAISALGTNLRGIPVIQSIAEAGLADIENRSIAQNRMPPNELYDSIRDEVLISGLTLKYTLDWHQEHLEALLNGDKKVFLLMLNPESNQAIEAEKAHASRGMELTSEAKSVVRNIRKLGYLEHSNFGLRFYEQIPPFTGVLIDGNVELSSSSSDTNGIVRVQPRTAFGIQHKGLVFQFRKIVGADTGAFDFFASDLRLQWGKAKPTK
jgi:hypothetical protein